MTWRRHPITPDNDYKYLLDGDVHVLTPGDDFGTVNAFRVRLSRMTKVQGVRYRTQMVENRLWVQFYRTTPGDLLSEQVPEAEDESQGLWPAQ